MKTSTVWFQGWDGPRWNIHLFLMFGSESTSGRVLLHGNIPWRSGVISFLNLKEFVRPTWDTGFCPCMANCRWSGEEKRRGWPARFEHRCVSYGWAPPQPLPWASSAPVPTTCGRAPHPSPAAWAPACPAVEATYLHGGAGRAMWRRGMMANSAREIGRVVRFVRPHWKCPSSHGCSPSQVSDPSFGVSKVQTKQKTGQSRPPSTKHQTGLSRL